MAIDKNSNAYTITFAVIMVVVVGAILALLATGLKPLQKKNEADKKMMDIVAAVKQTATRSNAAEIFNQNIVKRIVLNNSGEVLSSIDGGIQDPAALDKDDPFNVDIKKQFKNTGLKDDERRYPLFVCKSSEGKEYFVIPMVGKGLWGPIWGYVSLENDFETVYGAKFDHKTETPGLGAEIKEQAFCDQFPGKKLTDEQGTLVSIEVKKGGAVPADNPNQVDAITGGTITSDGVTEMMKRTFRIYNNYFKTL